MWCLKKGLYGLVQAGRTWNEEPNAHIESEGFTATPKDPTMYIQNIWTDRDFAAARFWVDNCVTMGSRKELTALADGANAKYGITGLGKVGWVLGMLLERDRPARTISISQEEFIDSTLTRFNLTDVATIATPLTPGTPLPADDRPISKNEIKEIANRPYRELVGALAWLTLGTRPDIAFATSSLARFGHNPGRVHWDVAKRVVRYLKGTKQRRLTPGGKSPQIAIFTSQMLTGEATTTTNAQSERIPSRPEMGSSA